MKLSLSVRVAEQLSNKRSPAMPLDALADVAVSAGYSALCMRASQLGIWTPLDEVREQRRRLGSKGLAVSMVTGDFPIPENTDDAPDAPTEHHPVPGPGRGPGRRPAADRHEDRRGHPLGPAGVR